MHEFGSHVSVLSSTIPSKLGCTNTHRSEVAMAIMGGYGGLYVLFKIKSAVSKKAPAEAAAPASSSSAPAGGVPSLDSPEFGEWLGSDAFNAFVEKA